MSWFHKYRKAWVAAAGVAAVVIKAYSDGHIDPQEWGEIAIAAVTALGVLGIGNRDPNAPAATAPKAGLHR